MKTLFAKAEQKETIMPQRDNNNVRNQKLGEKKGSFIEEDY